MEQLPAALWIKSAVSYLIHYTFILKFAQPKYKLKGNTLITWYCMIHQPHSIQIPSLFLEGSRQHNCSD